MQRNLSLRIGNVQTESASRPIEDVIIPTLSFKSPPFTDNFGTLHALLEERKTKGCPGLLGTALAISQATMGIVGAFGFLRIPT